MKRINLFLFAAPLILNAGGDQAQSWDPLVRNRHAPAFLGAAGRERTSPARAPAEGRSIAGTPFIWMFKLKKVISPLDGDRHKLDEWNVHLGDC